ncbi:THUMP domain-containing protein [Methanobacterium ferruginis]|jgi:tRNA(Ser,Leu) C12 N-acetylase TAN1|uniref:THUMP domain-containing protein n=1 Tax=Methanobacterium ferruginis TaxID=710191 RepID=UPI002572BAA5|nr:THUMP domain-containing protein [Methanobacterium ferruginis]BDZ68519.1 hypothetical protein GCM10025860_19670 [Methanobacterium ferruginis]
MIEKYVIEKDLNTEPEIDSFDLLISFKEGNDGSEEEVKGIEEIGVALENKRFYIKESEFDDVVTLELNTSDPVKLVEQFAKTPTEVIEKVIPVDTVVPSTMDNIRESILEFAATNMVPKGSFTVQCINRSKRYLEPSNEVVNQISTEISDKLNVNYDDKNTDWVIHIEEIGKITGIAIRRPDETLIK